MLKSKTVFVVGAGASHEVNLPTGEKLKAEISNLLDVRFEDWSTQIESGDREIAQVLVRHGQTIAPGGHGTNLLLDRCWQIRDAMPAAASIDFYLDAHSGDRELELCGKMAIARAILMAEQSSLLADNDGGSFQFNDVTQTWLNPFFAMLTAGLHRQNVAQIGDSLSFVIFNYDRCIEHFLQYAIAKYYKMSEGEAQQVVCSIPIHHPYGQIGFLPWQEVGLRIPFGYNGNIDLLGLADQIRTFTEKVGDTEKLDALRKTVADAETIVFLGFSYHDQNIELLTPDRANNCRRIFGTTFGMSGSDQQTVQNEVLKMLRRPGVHSGASMTPIQMQPMPCASFVQAFARTLSAAV